MDPVKRARLSAILDEVTSEEMIAPNSLSHAEKLTRLRHTLTGILISYVLEIAGNIKQGCSRSYYEYIQARKAFKNDQVLGLTAPPESVLLRLVKGLKVEAHPSLVALGLGDEAPAEKASVEEALEYADKSTPYFFTARQRNALDTTIYGYLGIIEMMAPTISRANQDAVRLWQQVEDAIIAGLICVMFADAEHLQQVYYARELKWLRGERTYVDSTCDEYGWAKDKIKPLPRPAYPHILDFLPALRAAAKAAFPMVGVRVDSTDE